MGKLLEQWLAENSQTLARLQPGGGMPPPEMGFPPPGAEVSPAFGGEGQPQMPVAAPVSVQGPPPPAMAAFQPTPYQAPPLMQPTAFPEEEGGGALGTGVMDMIDAMRGEEEPMGPPIPGSPEDIASRMPPQGEPPPLPPGATGEPPPGAFEPPPPGEAGPYLEEPPAEPAEGAALDLDQYTPEGHRSAFKEGEIKTAQDAFAAAPEEVDKAIDAMEKSTGVPVAQSYEMITGNPPPAQMKKRKIGEFLFEFGLNLLAQPPGMAGAQEVGVAMQQTIGGRRARAERREVTARQRQIEEREYGLELRKLGLKEREIEALESGARGGSYADFTGQDGYLYTYDRRNNQARRVVGPDGKPIKAREKTTGTTAESVQRYNATIDAWKRRAEILGIEYSGQYELDALAAAERRLIGTRPSEMTDEQRRAAAMEEANSIKKTPEYLYGTPEERQEMLEEARSNAYNYLKYGETGEPARAPAGGTPDASRLQSGAATPVTDEAGNVTYWTLDANGEPRQVSPEEMAGR